LRVGNRVLVSESDGRIGPTRDRLTKYLYFGSLLYEMKRFNAWLCFWIVLLLCTALLLGGLGLIFLENHRGHVRLAEYIAQEYDVLMSEIAGVGEAIEPGYAVVNRSGWYFANGCLVQMSEECLAERRRREGNGRGQH